MSGLGLKSAVVFPADAGWYRLCVSRGDCCRALRSSAIRLRSGLSVVPAGCCWAGTRLTVTAGDNCCSGVFVDCAAAPAARNKMKMTVQYFITYLQDSQNSCPTGIRDVNAQWICADQA